MNLAERYTQKKQFEKEQRKVERKQRVRSLANRIIETMKDEEVIESLENYLVENGAVSITDFGCLCQDGACSWQVGLDNLLEPLFQEWAKKGVQVRASLRLTFEVETSRLSPFQIPEKTIEKIKEWNQIYKQQ